MTTIIAGQAISGQISGRAIWRTASKGHGMGRDGVTLSVIDDVGHLRDVLVQGPVCAVPPSAAHPVGEMAARAERQHARLVSALGQAGVTVRHLDRLLCSALGFADARDWIVERRVCEEGGDTRGSDITHWMSEQPPEILTRFLIDGTPQTALPEGLSRRGGAKAGWLIPPVEDLAAVRAGLRFIEGGAVVCPLKPAASRGSAIVISTVLNFSPLFDESRFEFWLSSDGADRSCPPIDGRDIAVPGGLVLVAAITASTSVQALYELSVALLRRTAGYAIFWLDLTAGGSTHLDDCFVPLGRDCVLVDGPALTASRAYAVHANRNGITLRVEPCQGDFLTAFARASGTRRLCLIDCGDHQGEVGEALRRLAPIVLSPGRILAFDAHQAGFPVLESQGIEVVAALDGSALSVGGRGPRVFASPLRAD